MKIRLRIILFASISFSTKLNLNSVLAPLRYRGWFTQGNESSLRGPRHRWRVAPTSRWNRNPSLVCGGAVALPANIDDGTVAVG